MATDGGPMLDALYIGLTLVLMASTLLLVRLCERV
ncbi:MAG: hypothetical protein JWO86_5355 [Myxococcaceae bacterium]|nr:hypothetical protein [Myxococcaceae bacterium]